MHSNVLVTVYCITYNQKNYIRRCLDNLVNQKTDFRYEIIVHDDASTDGTQDIVREYAAKYPDLIIPVIEEENQYSKSLDFFKTSMLPLASGKYCVECEGDDHWCDPDKLRLQVEALETHPECSICVHATDSVDANGARQSLHFPSVKIDHPILDTEEFMKYVLKDDVWLFHFSSIMISSDLFREYLSFMSKGYPAQFYKVGDLPQFLYFTTKGKLYYIDRVMSVYTVESGGFMSKVKKDPKFALRVHQGYVDGLKGFDEFSHYRFHSDVEAALIRRQFEVDRISRRFDRIVQHPEYRPLVRKRGLFKTIAFYVIGHIMLLFRKK